MSERMTSIELPGHHGAGMADYGRKTVAEMVKLIREHAELMKHDAEAILKAKDREFYVCTHLGVYVRRNLVVLQHGNSK